MALKVENITFDCSDPDTLAQWWAQAIGGEVNAVAPGEFVIMARPDGAGLAFQRVDDPTPGKNRDLGAAETGRHSFGDEFRWVVLADPAGNAFCVAGQ